MNFFHLFGLGRLEGLYIFTWILKLVNWMGVGLLKWRKMKKKQSIITIVLGENQNESNNNLMWLKANYLLSKIFAIMWSNWQNTFVFLLLNSIQYTVFFCAFSKTNNWYKSIRSFEYFFFSIEKPRKLLKMLHFDNFL